MSGILGWVTGFAVLAASYLLFAGQVSTGEALAAIPAVGGGFGFAVLHRRHARHEFHVGLADFGPLKDVPGALARDTVLVGAALLRGLFNPAGGAFMPRPFSAHGPVETGVAILADSVAPNGYVIDAGDDSLVLHRLVP